MGVLFFRRLKKEWGHFVQLPNYARRLMLSYAFHLASYPIVATFINAYLWRVSGNLWQIMGYNLGWIVGLPVGFYLNGLALRKVSPVRLYLIGSILSGVPACLVVFIPFQSVLPIIIFGLFYGIGAGLYWGNKNYLTLQITKGINRVYYVSLEQILDLFINVVVPAGIGWFIALTISGKIFSSAATYQIVMLIGLVLELACGLLVQPLKSMKVVMRGMWVRKPTGLWNQIRFFNVVYNTQVGINLVLTSILVLTLVGGEGILGTMQAVAAVVSALVLYVIGRKSKLSSLWKLIALGSLIYLSGAGLLAGIFNWLGAVIYSISVTATWAFQWSSSYTVIMEVMDREEKNPDRQYAYVCDNELFFNIGRIIGLGLIALLAAAVADKLAFKLAPLLIAVIQLPLAGIIFSLTKTLGRVDKNKNLLPAQSVI